MKVAIVHDFLTKIGGAEKVLALFHRLYPGAPIFTLLYDKEATRELFDRPEPIIIPSSLNSYPKMIRQNKKILLPMYPKAIEEFDLSEYDIVISFSNSYAHGVLTTPSTVHVCYCYSPMRYVWDWYHEYLQENNIGLNIRGLLIRRLLHSARLWDKVSSSRVDQWLTQSETVQARIKKYYGVKASIIYPPVNLEGIETQSNPGADYFLIVSRLEPYKKIDLAIEAFNRNGRQLLIVGMGSDEKRLKSIANHNIEFLGWQSDAAVKQYMKNSYALVFPGEEDFGLTPVESMAFGRPVVAYGRGGATETVIENKTGVLFLDQTVDSLNRAIKELDRIYADIKPGDCRAQAEKFSTEVFSSKITSFLNSSYKRLNNGQD